MERQEYRIGELAEKADVTRRTIHYYVNKGLLPPPRGSGVGSTYSHEHLLRILLIKMLQKRFLPLEKIREMVSGLTIEQVKEKLGNPEEFPDRVNEQEIRYTSQSLQDDVGTGYARIELGYGVELHCPQEFKSKHSEIIRAIVNYSKKLLEEK